jgi:hypothetical protein
MTSIPDRDVWLLRRQLAGQDLNGEVETLAGPLGRLARHLNGLTMEERQPTLEVFLLGFPGAEELIRRMAEVDPLGDTPEPGQPRRTAHLGDLSEANASGRFTWPRWFVRGHFTLLTSEPKVGKTRVGLDLARRIYLQLPWPDGHEPSFPPGTRTLWVPGDRQQDELRELAPAYGLPLEAVLLNASPEEPYGGVSLDDPENVDALRGRVEADRPGIVFIDTVWRATRRKLSREDEVNALMDPIIAIAQDFDVAIVGMMHASKDGETLGRRLEGLARAVVKLSKPDPEGQPARRKFWVDRANFLEPPPLGVTIRADGCDFDFHPPADAEPPRPGRPSESRNGARKFIGTALQKGGERVGNELCVEWKGGSKATFWRAANEMRDEGILEMEGGTGTGKQVTLRLAKSQADDDSSTDDGEDIPDP